MIEEIKEAMQYNKIALCKLDNFAKLKSTGILALALDLYKKRIGPAIIAELIATNSNGQIKTSASYLVKFLKRYEAENGKTLKLQRPRKKNVSPPITKVNRPTVSPAAKQEPVGGIINKNLI